MAKSVPHDNATSPLDDLHSIQQHVRALLKLSERVGCDLVAAPEKDGRMTGFIGVCSNPRRAAQFEAAWTATSETPFTEEAVVSGFELLKLQSGIGVDELHQAANSHRKTSDRWLSSDKSAEPRCRLFLTRCEGGVELDIHPAFCPPGLKVRLNPIQIASLCSSLTQSLTDILSTRPVEATQSESQPQFTTEVADGAE